MTDGDHERKPTQQDRKELMGRPSESSLNTAQSFSFSDNKCDSCGWSFSIKYPSLSSAESKGANVPLDTSEGISYRLMRHTS